jgi:hypothetical protein
LVGARSGEIDANGGTTRHGLANAVSHGDVRADEVDAHGWPGRDRLADTVANGDVRTDEIHPDCGHARTLKRKPHGAL